VIGKIISCKSFKNNYTTYFCMGSDEHGRGMWEIRNMYKISVGKPKGKRPAKKHWCAMECRPCIKMNFKE
jgi:hypothetical protein